jgi:membrane-associated phospholipid phosphatase
MYNQEHWLTDVIGGIIFGTLALLTMLAVSRLVLPPTRDEPRAPRHAEPPVPRQKAQREPALLGD